MSTSASSGGYKGHIWTVTEQLNVGDDDAIIHLQKILPLPGPHRQHMRHPGDTGDTFRLGLFRLECGSITDTHGTLISKLSGIDHRSLHQGQRKRQTWSCPSTKYDNENVVS